MQEVISVVTQAVAAILFCVALTLLILVFRVEQETLQQTAKLGSVPKWEVSID